MGPKDRYFGCAWAHLEANIPVKLLHGPWTEDRLSFLHTLNEGGANIDAENKAMLIKGLVEVIREDNYRAADVILNLEHRIERRSGYRTAFIIKPHTELLRVAVIEGGCHWDITMRLIWMESSDINFTDPAVVNWAEKKIEQGVCIGRWLLDKLEKRRNRDREAKEQLEIVGCDGLAMT
ncbi:MAG: hypothetical protein ALECFALPRED_000797 [Alectoria fallacina]|uniref:Uncharacterized protein n=1 Tax=Alectoria fallacina TaxID=1903189 RepID=A0A8H3JAW3_9LECA|nr:MAG: hypothetical protein ALECFALPRED_000797 [Alectoria fallacina]